MESINVDMRNARAKGTAVSRRRWRRKRGRHLRSGRKTRGKTQAGCVFRQRKVKIGRPQTTLDDIPTNFLRHYPAYKKGAFNLTELARLCGVSRTTAYKYISLLEQ